MSSYRSAYENYYKNINNSEEVKKDNKKCFTIGKKHGDSIDFKKGVNIQYNDKMINVVIKRIIQELTGAIILLIFFAGLKYSPSTQINEMHIKCKQTLEQKLTYNEYIDVFNTIQIGNIKGKDLSIGDFTTEDLKIENLKIKASNFMEYIKNNNNLK